MSMQYGFGLPVRGNLATHDSIVGMASHGERLGFTSATIADHIVFPTVVASQYPYDASGNHPSTGDAIEPLSLMAFAAGGTRTLRFVTSVLILPHRNPVLTAKMVATIDVLSRGRVTLGVGVGWLREEFEALAAPDFAKRGAVSDEYIAIFKKLWGPGPVEHHGEHYRFGPLRCAANPCRRSARTRPSGSAATAGRRCGAPRGSRMGGIRWERWTRRRCGRRNSPRCSMT
jgi:alkanesulfonate monooxygenase SsuD/methylene tetrahydromethanopterin reductase-like flavin-dependent oxidoreductase (luciferase family)